MRNKHIFRSEQLGALDWAKFVAAWMMVAGYLYSRGVLSVGMMLLFGLAFYPPFLRRHWENFKSNRFAWLCIAFFMSYALAGLWTADKENWLAMLRVKLPFLILPFAMLALPLEKVEARRILFSGVLLVMLSGMLYAFYYLLIDPSDFLNGLHFKGPVTGDYIRHTVGLSLTANLALYLLLNKKQLKLRLSALILAYSCLGAIFVYIHLQAAKSGLLTLYVLIAFFMVYHFYKKWNLKQILMVGGAAIILILVIVKTVPSVRYQVDRAQQEFRMLSEPVMGSEVGQASFILRLLSYDAALHIISEHPLTGVGPGDLHASMKEKYQQLYPEMKIELIPHNQFLCTAVVLGLPLTLVLLALVISPLARGREVYKLANMLLLLISLLIEAMLEVQFGVFVYLFFTLLWMAVFKSSGNPGSKPGLQLRPNRRPQPDPSPDPSPPTAL